MSMDEIYGDEEGKPKQALALSRFRLPYDDRMQEAFGMDRAGWRVLTDTIFPSAKSPEAIVMALSYCKQRNLDVFKRPVHIVPMWSSARGGMVETVWPGISELRTTAFRTGNYGGMDAPEFGNMIEQDFEGKATRGRDKGTTRKATIRFPEWCRITVYRLLAGRQCKFVGPKVYWLEAYAKWADTDVPNDMWAHRTIGQLEKCAESAALRRAFPEEIGNELTAEEMEGQRISAPGDTAREVQATQVDGPPDPGIALPKPVEDETSSAEDAIAQWLRDLDGAASGCEDAESLGKVQAGVLMPMEGKVTPEVWGEAKALIMAHANRIAENTQDEIAGDDGPPAP